MMTGTSISSSNSSSNPNPNVFTAAQWEELEQQALIYKYMVSGVPVPTDLILSVRRSLYNSTFSSSSSSSSSLSHQPTLGMWEGSFQYNQLYGYGRKIDLEPGRCRRTDGKKWRCSKEAYPDSKYCERHMHRGRNRSRKPVEYSSSSSTTTATATVHVSSSPSLTISKSVVDTYPQLASNQTNFMDYRYLQGMKDLGDDERSNNYNYFQLNNHQNYSRQLNNHQNYSRFNFQNLKEQQNKEEEAQGQHCFVMGTDFIKTSEERNKVNETTSKQPFHHFFATPKTTPNTNHDPNWVDADQQHHLINPPKSPLSTQDLFESKPRPYW